MSEILRVLCSEILDYAGLFPPAGLSLDEAVQNQRRYRKESSAWMLGRFVCPVARLPDLTRLNWVAWDGPLAVILPASKAENDFFNQFNDARSSIDAFTHPEVIDTLEMLWPADVVEEGNHNSFGRFLAKVAGTINTWDAWRRTFYFEFAAADPPLSDAMFEARLIAALDRLDHFNQVLGKSPYQFGVKFRTGGATAAAIPSSLRLAMVIAACRDAGVFWKATGGLHQSWRQPESDLGAPLHGFLNILAATTLASAQNLNAAAIETILEDDDPSHFRADGGAILWREHSMNAAQIGAARRAFRSFGSCSFDEPLQHLQAQGWL